MLRDIVRLTLNITTINQSISWKLAFIILIVIAFLKYLTIQGYNMVPVTEKYEPIKSTIYHKVNTIPPAPTPIP